MSPDVRRLLDESTPNDILRRGRSEAMMRSRDLPQVTYWPLDGPRTPTHPETWVRAGGYPGQIAGGLCHAEVMDADFTLYRNDEKGRIWRRVEHEEVIGAI